MILINIIYFFNDSYQCWMLDGPTNMRIKHNDTTNYDNAT